jgi:hypothetical protein
MSDLELNELISLAIVTRLYLKLEYFTGNLDKIIDKFLN